VQAETLSITEKIRGVLPYLRDKYGVGKLWLVGSRARGDHRVDSDVDLMVEFERRGISLFGFASLELDLQELLGLPVDLVERGAPRLRVARELEKDAVPI
jgi:uncharacterized protein